MKRPFACLALLAALLAAGCVRSPIPQFKDAMDVPVKTEWKLDLPEGVSAGDVDGVSIWDGQAFRPLDVQRAGKRLGLTPSFPYQRGTEFTVRIFLKDGRRQDVSLIADAFPDAKPGQVFEVKAVPALGFFYPYFLYIPEGMDLNDTHRLLVEPGSTDVSDDLLHHIERARAHLTPKRISRTIADELKVPVIVPVFPRPVVGPATHDLSRDTLLLAEGPLRRVDLQTMAIIKDARELLARNGVKTEEKIFMLGYIDTGHFTNRFAILHPELVRAVASGAVDGVVTLPTAEYAGQRLRYPVGIADLKEITGITFNMTEYRKVAQFIQMGEKDSNDRTLDGRVYAPEDTALIRNLLGAKMMPDRWEKTQAIYKELGVPAQFVTYKGLSHQPGPTSDLVAFFRLNQK